MRWKQYDLSAVGPRIYLNVIAAIQRSPFVAHVVVETPASINFFLRPSGQLTTSAPQAHAVIRQYAVLLLSSIITASSFALRDLDELSGQVAGAFALYHLAPLVRASGRLVGRQGFWGPLLFLAAHGVCLAGFVRCFWACYLQRLFAA